MGKDFADTYRDAPPLNDLDSNLALMLMDNPVLRTQYERAVKQALEDAGVAPGSDVVWSGFSQGGIMAGNLGADSALPYNTVGVVTNGAPIDGFDIPDHIPVLQVEHYADPVPMLDGRTPEVRQPQMYSGPLGPLATGAGEVPQNKDWVRLPNPGGSLDPTRTHSGRTYADDFASYLRDGGQLRNDWSFLDGNVEEVYVAKTGE
jgi:hypothetical protein